MASEANETETQRSSCNSMNSSTPIPTGPAPTSVHRGAWESVRHHVILPLVATFNVPPYSVSMWFFLYTMALWTTEYNWLRAVMLLYWGYCFVNKAAEAPQKSSFIRRFQQVGNKHLPFLRMTAEYFPVSLIKTTELPPEKPYLFSYHPHGVIGMGVSCAMTTDGCGFSTKFPGVDRSCVTLNMNFIAPIYRHWMLWMGCVSPNKKTLKSRLKHGESLLLLPGGAAEALHAHPHSMKLYIRNRKGFVKLAMETNVALVPVFGFGENDAFDTAYMADEEDDNDRKPAGGASWSTSFRHMIWTMQKKMYQINTYSMPLWFHIIPRRRPINVVVGAPIHFPKDMSVEEGHQLYLDALRKLYDKHRDQHGYQDVKLEFL